ncbi:conserved Plasmodium protein, unknown function [Plasmodium knowlesi strain H]|uniref:Uncharacterized protein n=3 Tax=Plasmodium knowlesi TaxID=5850 RepID=A0A5K1VJG8_PLAKH|nr:conserved Plasmodium protein, unknown function [Plasmodium knowlesi strain H]OTN66569.1 Uncharacterized protein PKNOH_S08473100 [Plasmodium knowlesi]CAA9990056.1 conserved Plasmodium protein, unknown function [Plasmodium knowlesi strain H]SBO25715.1 conserved Plasmodium protein, unknown function [Plasmodium knowlesi strain H]SBO28528.1 conserved Plasmodium protein, unknown function [Plasmodium knowlesi strain H]VVS79530.1 conserved Plasmodium protein, unknown function [Plasmodium knowlesi s|eukprot:XP_002260523.1 hypothetical protein, conserved in Plasmodium species [Plasmodium knowlesi strain H]
MNVNRMYSKQSDIMYLQSRRNVTQYYVLSLLSDFIKTMLLLFDRLAFYFTISIALLMMLFGYVGVISEKPIALHGMLYIGTVYLDILLNFLIALVFISNLVGMSMWNVSYMAIFIEDRNFYYSIMSMIIGLSFLSIVFNICVLYYTQRFKTLVTTIENEAKNAGTNDRSHVRSNLSSSTKGSNSARGNANIRVNVQGNIDTIGKTHTKRKIYIHGNVFSPGRVPIGGNSPREGNALAPWNAPSNGNGNKSGKTQRLGSISRKEKEKSTTSGEKISITIDENNGLRGKPLGGAYTFGKTSFNVSKMVSALDGETKINDMLEDNAKKKLNMEKKITPGLDKEQQSLESRKNKFVNGDTAPMKVEIIKEEVK